MTGSKSRSKTYEIPCTSAGAATDGTDMPNKLCPSAGWVSTSFAAIVVTPPGRFSTITRQCSSSVNCFAMIRLMMSGGVLAEFGATKRMVLLGKTASACADNPGANAMMKPRHRFILENFAAWKLSRNAEVSQFQKNPPVRPSCDPTGGTDQHK